MQYVNTFAWLALHLLLASANAQDAALDGACPILQMAAPVRYSRLHQIPTVAPRDDISHKIVTPGGMVLDAPRMVAATDELTIVARDPAVLCFRLLTFARERRTCELTGVARKESDGTYLLRDDSVLVRFTFIGEDQVSVEPVGTGYRNRCEPSGKIEQAIYTLSPKSL